MNEEGQTILVAEDDAKIRRLIATVLRSRGFRVMEAQNGLEAVQLYGFHHAEIALVVTDLEMPVMDGWQAVARIHAIDGAARMLVLSARAADGPPDCYRLQKPFVPAQLLEAVELALQRAG